ncbi:hypothetical protein ACLB2K_072745 [Fragaria x ananassa]
MISVVYADSAYGFFAKFPMRSSSPARLDSSKVLLVGQKCPLAQTPTSVIDEISAGKKRKKAETENAKKQSEEESEKPNKPKRKKKKDLGFVNGAFVDETSELEKRTNDGLAIYIEEELGFNKADA